MPAPLGAYDADIIILAYGRENETKEAIASALAQRGGNFHVSVLDQGSPPQTRYNIATTFGKAARFAFYTTEQNTGVAGGRNLISAQGHGQIIIALDNDSVFEHPWVAARAVEAFQRRPELGALGFCILAQDRRQPDLTSWGYPKSLLGRYRGRFETTTFVGAGHAIRRLTWERIGGYDPRFFFTWEEYDFCLRAIALGWRIAYDGSLGVIHKVSPEARINWSEQRMTCFVRNRLLIGRKWKQSWLALTPRIVGYLIKAHRHGCQKAALEGVRAALRLDIQPHHPMPHQLRRYIAEHETRHRGSWLNRLRTELFGRLPTA